MKTLSSAQLRQAADVQSQIETLQEQLQKLLQGDSVGAPDGIVSRTDAPILTAAPEPNGEPSGRPKRQMSAAGRKRIAAAQRARWAKTKAGQSATATNT